MRPRNAERLTRNSCHPVTQLCMRLIILTEDRQLGTADINLFRLLSKYCFYEVIKSPGGPPPRAY